ncbi:hypothetical protein JCM19992_17770 [Thermostilla marina]
MNPAFRRTYGLVLEEETTAVIDASGFAFGDQHGPRPTEAMLDRCRRWKTQGKKIVLLPQAFGPFSSRRIREAARAMLEFCDLVFAREETSYRHVVDVAGQLPHIRTAPDFTVLVEGDRSASQNIGNNVAFIVPNMRMLDKTDENIRKDYVPFLGNVITTLRNMDLRPVVLLHTPEDKALVPRIAEAVGKRIDIVEESCPVRLKGMLGTAHLVVSSRFHAVVGALSQGVPTLACGWSHKYEELLSDFDCPEGVLSVHDTPRLHEIVQPFVDDGPRREIVARIQTAGRRLREQVLAMWKQVDAVLGFDQSG